MKRPVAIPEGLPGLAALACAAAVFLGTVLEAEANLGSASTVATSPRGPSATADPPGP